MDRNTNPCDDFYQYACGKWIRNNPTQDGETSVDRYENLRTSNDEFIKKLIASSQSRDEYRAVNTIKKTFQHYDSCMDTNTINKLGAQPIRSLLQRYDLWVDKNWDEGAWNFEDVLISLLEDFGSKALFELNVELGMTNNSFYFISVSDSRHATIGSSRNNRVDKQFMVNVTRALGLAITSMELQSILDFERKLAKSALPESNIDYNKMTMAELEMELDDTPIYWLYVLRQVIPSARINNNTVIILNGKRYFKQLMNHIKVTPKRTLANYMMWKLVYDQHLMLGQTFWDFHRDYKTAIGKPWTQADRGDTCMEELSSLKGFALPLTRVFVDKKFKGDNKQWILDATERIRNTFISNLKENLWMDEATNHNAKRKAKSLKEVIGYPDFIMNDTALDLFYNDIVIDKSTYFENHLSLVKFWTKTKYALVGKPRDDEEWSMSPVEINAQYEDSFNRMVFPVAILQPPFYSGNYSSAVNFGGIGTVMGHELTHGFDDSGKSYDENGQRQDWWSQVTLSKFQAKSKCLSDQYSDYMFHGRIVNGERSLSENIADNGGVKLAFTAYRSWVDEHGEEPVLPRTHLTNEQIFFVSFAQNWCASYSSDGIAQEMTSNYSPTPIRVNGSLKNFKEFALVFNCNPGTPMNPTQKCGLW
ncbi:hypothetical protein QZH41_008290 [Actinostola sp. cb2023]|nr:hypothetical protein QZH41_008290 [Actinostola sp. cb2023]